MITVGAFEAKTKLSELLDRVERGEEVLITRHGKNVARLVADHSADAAKESALAEARAASIMAEFDRIRNELRANGISWTVEDIISARDEGRR